MKLPPLRRIIKNKAECRLCGDIIESKTRHDFVTCKCSEISVDGGTDYIKRSARHMNNAIDRSEYISMPRYVRYDGYIAIKVPKHKNANSRGYVMEHRLVYEEHLKRLLLPSEFIHHKDGNRQNNYLSNLELWVKMQPSGQRVKDLVEYAVKILSLYDKYKLNDSLCHHPRRDIIDVKAAMEMFDLMEKYSKNKS